MVKSALGATRGGKRTAGIVVAVVVVALIIFGGGAYLFTQLFTGQIRQVGQMQTMQLTASSYAPKVEASGSFRAASSAAVSPEVDGTINDVKVKSGDAVKKGDVLFTIDNAQITQEANSAKTAYDEATAALTTANSALEEANSKLKTAQEARDTAKSAAETRDAAEAARQQRDQQSSATQKRSAASVGATIVPVTSASGSTSTFDSTAYDAAVDEAQSEVDKAQSQVDTAKKTADAAKTTYDNAAAKAEKLTVSAPSDGTVVDLKVQKGMTSQAVNSQGAALQIADLSTLTAVVTVPASQIATISTGLKATITSSSLPDQTINATVSKVGDAPVAASTATQNSSSSNSSSNASTNSTTTQTSWTRASVLKTASSSSNSSSGSSSASGSSSSSSQSTQDSSTSYYEVTLTLEKADNAKVGMEVSAAIELKEYSTVYYVPEKAVSQSGSYAYVEVVYNDSTTKQHQVQILDESDDGQLIIQGSTITEGQRILADIS